LSAPLSLMVATAQVGSNLGVLTPATVSATLGASIVSATLYPLLARPFLMRQIRRANVRTSPLPLRLDPATLAARQVDEASA
ncbi:MAG: hypothetical protein KGO05_05345, partial [Chloroflexota bacterium]|nr:hypothetical protein [Chloroflexota bacterium]